MMCTALTAKASTCIAYDECIEDVNLTHEKTVTESECTDRLAVEVVLAKTKCHLLHLSKVFNNENSTNDCDAVTVDDSSLVCTLQEVPAVSACSDDDDIASPTLPSPPGFDCTKWIAAEYSSFNVSYKQVDTCKIEEQCNLPTHVGTHENIDGCIDSEDYCDFYGRHQDACSDYPGDNAAIKCCACSGGSTRSCDAAFDCSGHGTTTDTDTTDGCICECTDGYSGADCAIPPVDSKPNRCDFQGVCPPASNGSWTLSGAATWKKATGSGDTCTGVCAAIGKSCTDESMDLQARVCSRTIMNDMNILAGGAGTSACKSTGGGTRNYAGTPFQQTQKEDCYWFDPAQCGDMSACDSNKKFSHKPLCACV